MLDIIKLSGAALREDLALCREIEILIGPSYQDPSAILAREISGCTHAYLGRARDQSLVCFFLTGWEPITVNGQNVPAIHLGLSGTSEKTKNRGHVGLLYLQCIRDALACEQQFATTLLLWSTTASPTVFLSVTRYLRECEPGMDGGFSDRGAQIAHALRNHLGAPPTAIDGHPFVLSAIADRTRYSESELSRISRVRLNKNFTLFEKLGIDENAHDRLLFIARTPKRLSATHLGVLERVASGSRKP